MAFLPIHRFRSLSSRNFLLISGIFLVAALLVTGCHQAITDPKDPKFIVAEKDDLKITRADLDKEISSILKQHRATPEQIGPAEMLKVETSVLKNLVLKDLLLAKAADLHLQDVDKAAADEFENVKSHVPPGQDFEQQLKTVGLSVDDVKKQIRERVIIEKVLDQEAFKNIEPTEQEINDFYNQNKDRMSTPAQVRASRILIHLDPKISASDKAAKKKAIDKAYSRVQHGEEFSKVAAQVSEDRSSAPKGGDIDFFQRGVNEPGFDDVAFNTKVGAVSSVFETSLGYQFLKVTDSKPAGQVPLADVRSKITAFLSQKKKQQIGKEYIDKLSANSGVIYHIKLADLNAPTPPPQPPAPAPAAPAPPSPAAQVTPANSNAAPSK